MPGLNYGNRYTLTYNSSQLKGRRGNRKTIYVFDLNEIFLYKYPKIEDACEKENINISTLKTCIKRRTIKNNKYYSYSETLQPTTKLF